MYVENIKLKNFRNYDQLELSFSKNVNIFIGNNAQGKTNILESIYLMSIARSFRTNKNNEMVQFDKNSAIVFGEINSNNYKKSIEIRIEKNANRFIKIDGLKIKKTSELMNNLYIVIFSPEDLKIVKDEPERRRKFIDRELCQINPSYYDNLTNYKKVLMQRNSYLKNEIVDKNLLDLWDSQLVKYGSRVSLQRKEFIEKINSISQRIHKSITNEKEELKIFYKPNIKIKEDKSDFEEYFYKEIKNSYETDLKHRNTNKGPHKDDIEFFIDGINARSFGSQGQQRTAALSLKLAEISIIEEETGEKPILLLDDVLSELDGSRQEFLIKTLSEVQLFITTTEISENIKEKFSLKKIFFVKEGKTEQI